MDGPHRPDGYQPAISSYGFLSDCYSAALVDRRGSVDWWCVPRFDSPSVFGRLLDPAAGHWTLRPVGDFSAERRYVGDSLVLETVHRTATGTVTVRDALLLEPGARGHRIGRVSPHALLRQVEGVQGSVRMATELSPRMEYGRTEPHLRLVSGGAEATGGPVTLNLRTHIPLQVQGGAVIAEFEVAEGATVDLQLSYAQTFDGGGQRPGPDPSVADTLDGWTSWAAQHTDYDGDYPDLVGRSSLVLQGLTYGPSGAVVA
ncbi:MAG: DUF5911 domain-containing protein, partial [Actinomycetota bacterium]|nr:DUF5911 domain-containing protein [Actinomycetota bacterium]